MAGLVLLIGLGLVMGWPVAFAVGFIWLMADREFS